MSLIDDAAQRRNADPGGEDPDVLERFLAHRDLAARLARRYDRSASRADLGQVADTALLLASRRYEPARGRFESFAAVTISGELKKYLRRTAWNVHVPRRVQEDAFAVRAGFDALSAELGRSPGVSEVAAATGLTIDRVTRAMQAHSSRFAAGELPPDRSASPPTTTEDADLLDLRRAVAQLAPDDRTLVALVFESDLTQRSVASRIGISQSEVQRRLARVLGTLERLLSGNAGTAGA